MKKITVILAISAALCACNKMGSGQGSDPSAAPAFEAGQEVLLTVSTPQTRATSELDGSNIEFKWEAGDKIKVTVGVKSSTFILNSGAGTSTGTFGGSMPASGDSFDVQYPVTDPDLSNQDYSATEPFPRNKAKFTATGCALGSPFTLDPVYSALQLNFYGTDITLDSIVVTNTSATPNLKYKLDGCAAAGALGTTSAAATPFRLVIPSGTSVSLKAEAFPQGGGSGPSVTLIDYVDGENYGPGTPIFFGGTTSFTTSKTLTAGQVMNMLAQEVSIPTEYVIWAPVNCGYDATNYPYGKIYQWGRHDGGGYGTSWTASSGGLSGSAETVIQETSLSTAPIDAASESSTTFYRIPNAPGDWLSSRDNNRWSSATGKDSPKDTTKVVPIKTAKDPCPPGWRVPTYYELKSLLNCTIITDATSTWSDTPSGQTIPGRTFYGNTSKTGNSIFLPAAGYRSIGEGEPKDRGIGGFYYSSSIEGTNYAKYLRFKKISTTVYVNGCGRAYGYSVRCVQDPGAVSSTVELDSFIVTGQQTW